jgi:diguanylate cyclase (GGDEF)-like protein
VQVAQDIQKQVRSIKIPHNTSTVDQYITLSMGMHSLNPSLKSSEIDLLNATDQALYQAKQTGRNCYCIYSQTLSKISVTGK